MAPVLLDEPPGRDSVFSLAICAENLLQDVIDVALGFFAVPFLALVVVFEERKIEAFDGTDQLAVGHQGLPRADLLHH